MDSPVVIVGHGHHKVLALHGWFGSAKSWGPLVEALDPTAFTYAFVDYRGYGARKHVQGSFTLEEIALDALGAADELGWQKFSLVGHSMGGAAIQHVLVAQPRRVRALVGITPVPASGVTVDEQTWRLLESAAGDGQARRAILDFSTGGRLSRYWLDRMVERSFERSSAQAFAAYLPAFLKTDISARVRGIDIPVHLVVGEHDAAGLTEEFVRRAWLSCYPAATVEVMPNAGHYPMEETPVALATSMERFLNSLPVT